MEITQLPAAASIDGSQDVFPIVTANINTTQKITRNTFLSISSQPVGLTDSQTLTNKALTSPSISSPALSGTVTGTYTLGGTPTFPSSVVTLTGNQTLTNKTLTSPTINTPSITNATITADTLSGFTTSNNGTVYGISVTGGAITSSSAIGSATVLPNALVAGAGSSWAGQSWVPTWGIMTIGNATVTAQYTQIGKRVDYNVYVLFGSTTVIGASEPTFTLPVTPSTFGLGNLFMPVGDLSCAVSVAGTQFFGKAILSSTGIVTLFSTDASATTAKAGQLSTSVPFTWTTGSVLEVSGSYLAA